MKTYENKKMKDLRSGFGEGLVDAGAQNAEVVALSADVTGSVKMDAFASSLCVGNANITSGTTVNMTEASAAALFDVNDSNIIYGKNII